ncbi:NUDIX hydrolase [Micromonospora sp. CPCC 206061]|uniref:NUDIX hydrolase n=1 Tax=Micromonospora sp. CPCC 206061 TaxID=3122410 RepID=UPI002FEF6D1F
MSTWIDPKTWYQQLPSFYASAAALITSPDGDVLLVKPTYRDHWAFPGGYIEAGEYPHEGCDREIREELALQMPVGPLLVLDWAPPAGPRPRAIISFTFDCGTLPDLSSIKLDSDELEDCAFLPPDEATSRLPTNVAPRVKAALEARHLGKTLYLSSSANSI